MKIRRSDLKKLVGHLLEHGEVVWPLDAEAEPLPASLPSATIVSMAEEVDVVTFHQRMRHAEPLIALQSLLGLPLKLEMQVRRGEVQRIRFVVATPRGMTPRQLKSKQRNVLDRLARHRVSCVFR